jgi:hypothetical protein
MDVQDDVGDARGEEAEARDQGGAQALLNGGGNAKLQQLEVKVETLEE